MGPYLNATGIGVWSQQPNFQRTPSITSLEVMWLILTAAGDQALGRLKSRVLFHFGTMEGTWLTDPYPGP
jgi:hypothetical protein